MPQESPQQRVVFLGASNVLRTISTAVSTAEAAWQAPLEVLAAIGHGRSYLGASWFLGRQLPGILQCGIWDALAARSALPSVAVVTDIGNDLLYGASVERIVGGVAACLERLQAAECRMVMTGLPLARLERLTPAGYYVLRTISYPACRIPYEQAVADARELDAQLADLAEGNKIPLVAPPAEWYGLDPVHVRRRTAETVWKTVFSACPDVPRFVRADRGSLLRWLYLRTRRPAEFRFLGLPGRGRQPSGRLRSGSTIALY